VACLTQRPEGEGLRLCYDRSMAEIASRELRNNTAGVLDRVQAGEDVVITVNGRAVARLVPLQPARRRWLPRAELVTRLRVAQADSGLRSDLALIAGETTDDLAPIR
jgi:prevent-host-death family protein